MNCKTVLLKDLVLGEKGSYGIGAPAVDYDPKKYTYLRITDINDDGSINTNGLKSVDAEDAYKYILQENDIVFARTGASTGKTYFYQPQDGTLVYAGFLIKFSIDPQKVNPRLLKYITHSQEYYNWVRSFDTGGTRGNINAVTFANMPITLPDRATQDKIVAILSSLDDKIELNRRINANLEQQAQALYKSWFVEFEPFGGKMPEDWREGTLGEICTELKEKVHDRDDVKVLSPVATGQLMLSEEFFTKQVYSKSIAKYIVVPQNCFAYNPARVNIGSLGMNEFDFDGCVSPVYVVFRCLNGYEYFFDLFRRTKPFKDEVKLRAIGGVRQTLGYDDFARIQVNIPTCNVVQDFNKIYLTNLDVRWYNQYEILRLAHLRDTLLPKLMSGEIKVPTN